MVRVKTLNTTLALLVSLKAFCQSDYTYKDFQVWQNFEIEYNLNKKWLGRIQEQARVTDNAYRLSYYYGDFGIMYKLKQNLRLNLDYIFIQKRDRPDGKISTRHQYNVYLNFRKKFHRVTLYDRILNEGQFVDYNTSKLGKQLRDFYIRNKVSARYYLTKRIVPFVYDEIYYKVDGKAYERLFNRNRLGGGIYYRLTRYWLMEVVYIWENNFNVPKPRMNYIFGFGLSRSFYQ